MPLFSRRKLGVCGTTRERPETGYDKMLIRVVFDIPEFESFAWRMIGCCVQVRLPEDDHPDVGVEIDFAGLGAGEPQVDEVAKPLP